MNMGARERDISFLNMYFVYKKVRSVDAREVMYGQLGDSMSDQAREAIDTAQKAAVEAVEGAEMKRSSVRKTGRKLKLRKA